MREKNALKKLLLFTGVCFHSLVLPAQTQEKVTDNVWLMVTESKSERQATNTNYFKWPEASIKERASNGLYIDEVIFTASGWNILFSNKYKKQQISRSWNNDFYKKGKADGLSLTELSYGESGWVMVMSDMPKPEGNGYALSKTWEELVNNAKTASSKIFKLAYGNNQWLALTSQNTTYTAQLFQKSNAFPADWLQANTKNGYTVTDAVYAKGNWHVIMSKPAQSVKQNVYLTDKWEYKPLWDRKEYQGIVHFAYDMEKAKETSSNYSKAASAAFEKRDYKTAILNYTNAIKTYGYDVLAYKNRGVSKLNLKQYDGAIQDFSFVLKNFSDKDVYSLGLRAKSYMATSKYKEAIVDYTNVLAAQKDGSKHLDYYVQRSAAYEALGDYQKASSDINKALQLKPSDATYTAAKKRLTGLIEESKPVITWDKPFNINTTVDKAQYNLSSCITATKQEAVKAVKILVNGKELNRNTRGFTVEAECTNNISQNVTLASGRNEIEIVVTTNNAEVRSEKRVITYNANKSKNNYHALLIGVADYKDPAIGKLNKPVKDVESLQKTLLSKYTFEKEDIHVLRNPTKAQIAAKFRELKTNLTDADNLLIFYAGHGTVDSVEDKLFRTMEYSGYWLPADAKMNDKASWLENSEIYDFINELPSKHTLVVADACFSGSLLNAGKKRAISSSQQATNLALNCDVLATNPSLKAMTSGNLTEVPDKSLFMASFLNALDDNTESCMPADDLFYLVNRIMRRHQVGQESKYQPFQSEKHQNGEFVFKKR